jgi:type II secretory pathway pseudopilin PulG
MKKRIDNMVMDLRGQGANPSRRCGLDDGGFVMVALLIGMAVAAIWMGAAIPAWRQQAMREREAELIFRGEQYARAIVLYQKKNQGQYPPSIDTLVSDRYLRKKWKDPVSGKDFLPVQIGGSQPAGNRGAGQAPISQPQPQQQAGGALQGSVIGVRSPSQATSIKIYKQQQQHGLWPFDAMQLYAKMGYSPGRQGGPQGAGGPGGRGQGPGTGVGNPGRGLPPRGGGDSGPIRGGGRGPVPGGGRGPLQPGGGGPVRPAPGGAGS